MTTNDVTATERADLLEVLTKHRDFLRFIAETAQHAGHSDIIREALDRAKSMG